MRALRTLMLALGLSLCTGVQAEPAVYFVDHTIRAPGHAGTMRTLGFNRLALEAGSAGEQRLHTQPLWSQLRGGGQWRSTDDLDPDDAIDAALIQLLDAGFEVRISADGKPGPMRAVDEIAWARVLKQRPRAAQALVDAPQTLGLQVRALPDGLKAGQIIRQHARSPAIGRIDTRLEVVAVDDAVAVLAMHIEGDTLTGSGRQAVRLADGMPLDVSLRLDMDAADGLPVTEQRLRMVALDTIPTLDLSDSNTAMAGYEAERLAAPPFSGPSDDPTLYRNDPPPRGVLLQDMLAPERLETIAAQLAFGVEPRRMGRARLVMGAEIKSDASGTDDGPPPLFGRLRSVTLRDAADRPLSGLEAVPVRPMLALVGQWHSDEGEADFPFRLPPGVRDEALAALATIDLEMEVETYAWDGVETVAYGEQPQSQPGARFDWRSPRHIGFEQARARPDETDALWSIAVPLDADGRPLPQASLMRRGRNAEALDWEWRHTPQRTEIATSAPIAAVELRRYRWRMLPHVLSFKRIESIE
ncbi:hypothetical protein [Luteimonas terrae]|uniref:Uncharacterized protein n=1 Tax=Luteimonas terrae TaxID=1530191 RepID=A0ABU1XTH0_9GAMM|nr:hypothetical protein [Luteimonas terrae]MDR7191863.1 hypothetical protein [Luteimonas terrae]